uniref:Uncharacterized protein n=1 Tax=Romanomermis culicivorax TaxID=13658 RepID=A0A915HR21_ROMCU
MGCICGKFDDDDDDNNDHNRDKTGHHAPNSTVAMLAQSLQKSGLIAAMSTFEGDNNVLTSMDVDRRVRKAKAQMRTVNIMNGCLYIDYEFVGRIPANYGT